MIFQFQRPSPTFAGFCFRADDLLLAIVRLKWY